MTRFNSIVGNKSYHTTRGQIFSLLLKLIYFAAVPPPAKKENCRWPSVAVRVVTRRIKAIDQKLCTGGSFVDFGSSLVSKWLFVGFLGQSQVGKQTYQ